MTYLLRKDVTTAPDMRVAVAVKFDQTDRQRVYDYLISVGGWHEERGEYYGPSGGMKVGFATDMSQVQVDRNTPDPILEKIIDILHPKYFMDLVKDFEHPIWRAISELRP